MNLGLLMSIGSPSMPTTSSVSATSGTAALGFGSVFQDMMASSEFSEAEQSLASDGKLAQLMDDIMNAETLEELAGLLDQLKQRDKKLPAAAYLLNELGYRQSLPTKATVKETLVIPEVQDEQQLEEMLPVDNHREQQPVEMLPVDGIGNTLASVIKKQVDQTDGLEMENIKKTSEQQPIIEFERVGKGTKEDAVQLPNQVISEIEVETMQLLDLTNLQKFPSLQQLASLISENPDKLVEVITNVLEVAGVTKEQVEQIQATEDVWFVLDVLQTVPPEKIQLAVQQLPEKLVVEMTALFKAIELAAPKMDLYSGQVELTKTIQPLLAQFATKIEDKTVQPEVKQTIQLPTVMQHMIRFTTEQSATDTKQQDQQAKPSETSSIQSVLPQTESRPVFQMTQVEKAPESRSEALMREFQAILNRANFGQTNGMNRLSIKLYPEQLGQVRIELLEVNGVMTARILASSSMAREMLDSQMHQLRHAFNQQNLQVDRIELSQSLQDPSKSDREQAFNKQNGQQRQQQTEQEQQQDQQDMTFEEFMIELEV